MPDEQRAMIFVQKVAARKTWELNTDTVFVERVAQGLKKNLDRYGYYLCPCRDGEGDRDLDRDIVCPCEYSPADIAEYGQCYCGLFISPEFKLSGKKPVTIPERKN